MTFVIGRTALHWAAAVNNEEAAQALIRHHANVDAQDEHSQTALFLAAREGSYQVAKILLQFGKANADLPDHMECFPRNIALERQHHDIAQLIADFARSLSGPEGLGTLPLSQAGGGASVGMNGQASSGKGRSKKSSASQRKLTARSVSGNAEHEEDGLLGHCRRPGESGLGLHPDRARPKKTKRQRVASMPPICQSVHQPQLPPSYENAVNGQRAQFVAMQQQATGMGPDSRPVYHTGVAFEQPHHFEEPPDVAYAGVMPSEANCFSLQPNGLVLQPSSFFTLGLGEADPSSMVHASPTVPSCHAYLPQSMSAVQGPEATVVSSGRRSQPLSPTHRQMLQQRMQHYQSPHHVHHPHQHSNQHLPNPVMSDGFDASSSTYILPVSTVPDTSTYPLPTPSSATSSTNIMFQYPTPPSHHSTTETTSPSLVQQTAGNPLNGYPTPSPEASPEQWSSLSPNSANSDWSEHARNNSPKRAVTNMANQSDIKNEPAYL